MLILFVFLETVPVSEWYILGLYKCRSINIASSIGNTNTTHVLKTVLDLILPPVFSCLVTVQNIITKNNSLSRKKVCIFKFYILCI